MNFLPTTPEELKKLGWSKLDVILITGDTYIDSPYIGVAVIGRVLADHGLKVGIIAQPDIESDEIRRLGEPALFWGVSGGSIDSMVANYTASGKRRKQDDFTPGGQNTRRPDRAVIAYTNLIRKNFKQTKPIVLGGIEASLRRGAHYDFRTNKIRKPILFDAKADILVYGMAENTIIEVAEALRAGTDLQNIRGICYIDKSVPQDYTTLLPFDQTSKNKRNFSRTFNLFHKNNEPLTACGLAQKIDSRYLIQTPPAPYLSQQELDRVHELAFTRSVHPFYLKQGKVRAQDTIQFAITSHRGCYGECSFLCNRSSPRPNRYQPQPGIDPS